MWIIAWRGNVMDAMSAHAAGPFSFTRLLKVPHGIVLVCFGDASTHSYRPQISPVLCAGGAFCGGVVQCDLLSRRPLLGSRTQTTDQAATPGCSRRLFLIYGVPVSRDALGATLFLAIAQVSGSCLLYGLTGSFLLIIRILYALAVAACLSASSLADLAQLK